MSIGKNINVNRCPQADYDGIPCCNCKVKDNLIEWLECPHMIVHEQEQKTGRRLKES